MSNDEIKNRLESEADTWIARKDAERAAAAIKRERAAKAQAIMVAVAMAFALIGGLSAIYIAVMYFIGPGLLR